MKQFIFLLSLSFIFFACKRKGEPIPRICTEAVSSVGDLVTMKLSDTLVLVNCSERFSKQRWVMPDGGSSTNETVYFVPPYADTFEVQLFVSDNDFVNEYQAIKRVAVLP